MVEIFASETVPRRYPEKIQLAIFFTKNDDLDFPEEDGFLFFFACLQTKRID